MSPTVPPRDVTPLPSAMGFAGSAGSCSAKSTLSQPHGQRPTTRNSSRPADRGTASGDTAEHSSVARITATSSGVMGRSIFARGLTQVVSADHQKASPAPGGERRYTSMVARPSERRNQGGIEAGRTKIRFPPVMRRVCQGDGRSSEDGFRLLPLTDFRPNCSRT